MRWSFIACEDSDCECAAIDDSASEGKPKRRFASRSVNFRQYDTASTHETSSTGKRRASKSFTLALPPPIRLNFRAAPRSLHKDEWGMRTLRFHARRARLRWDGSRVYSPFAALRPIEW